MAKTDLIAALVDRFLAWPVPETACADLCATKQQSGRSGTHFFTAAEARQFIEYLMGSSAMAARDAEIAAEAVAREATFWLIERYINSELRYWTGRRSDVSPWEPGIGDAVRFADYNSASVVLAHLCEGIGRVAEHAFVKPRQEPQPAACVASPLCAGCDGHGVPIATRDGSTVYSRC